MMNIGFVLYTKGDAPGTLNARWNYANAFSVSMIIETRAGVIT